MIFQAFFVEQFGSQNSEQSSKMNFLLIFKEICQNLYYPAKLTLKIRGSGNKKTLVYEQPYKFLEFIVFII